MVKFLDGISSCRNGQTLMKYAKENAVKKLNLLKDLRIVPCAHRAILISLMIKTAAVMT